MSNKITHDVCKLLAKGYAEFRSKLGVKPSWRTCWVVAEDISLFHEYVKKEHKMYLSNKMAKSIIFEAKQQTPNEWND